MEYPSGFKELVALVRKSPVVKINGKGIWDRFCKVVLIGKGRSEADIVFLQNMLKKYLDYDYVLKISGSDWMESVEEFLDERLKRIRDEDAQTTVAELRKILFPVMASLKGGARFFEKKKLFENMDKLTKDKEKTSELIEEIIEDQDVPGIRYAKAIMWLHSTGRAKDFAPPTKQLKSFLNSDIGPYHPYYDDDDYFMQKAEEMGRDFNCSLMDIYRAIFFYRTLKSVLPRGSKFAPRKLVSFLKKKKIPIKKLSVVLGDMDGREKLAEDLYEFVKG